MATKKNKKQTKRHTPGPWTFAYTETYGERLTVFKGRAPGLVMICDGLSLEDARRIIACINACEGIIDPLRFMEAAKESVGKYFVADQSELS